MQGYKSIDQILHQLSQVIAKVNKAYLPHQPDDSHTNLYFDELGQRITGRWFPEKGTKYLLVFDIPKWEYKILDDKLSVIHSVSQNGKMAAESEAILSKALDQLGFSTEKLMDPLNFKIPKYPFLQEKLNQPDHKASQSWIGIRSLANQTSLILLGYLQKEAEIRIWPHHFDTGIYVEVNADVGIGFGLAMADAMIDSPYFYLAGYGLKDKSWDWEKVGTLEAGKWMISEHWKGAVLPITTAKMEAQQPASFIHGALNWYLS